MDGSIIEPCIDMNRVRKKKFYLCIHWKYTRHSTKGTISEIVKIIKNVVKNQHFFICVSSRKEISHANN